MPGSSPLIGRTISHYRIVEKIGAGGMGEVYRAHDEQLDRDVALKVLPPGTLADEAARKQFRKEALALAKLNHPNIETVHEFGTEDGVDFLAMELIAGSSISEKLKAGPLPDKEIVRLGMQFAEGLAAAHGQGVVHRDLKPSNLMITPDGRLKILDFGLAKLVHHDLGGDVTRSITVETGTISGTVPYMSPEQLRGLPVDARSDIYAAGAVLYEMATCHRPFPQSQSVELMGAILHQAPATPSSLNPRIAAGLESVILKALEKEPSQRYQSARELLIALEGISSGVAATASVSSATPAGATTSHRRWLLLAVTVVVIALAAGGFWWLNGRKAHALTEKDTIVLADFTNHTGDPVFDDALREALAADLTQSPFLNILSDAQTGGTLRLMGRAANERLTPEIAREACERVQGKAYLAGSISALGSSYAVSLVAVNCQTGDTMAREQSQAAGKEKVLDALGQAATKLREKLGESLRSIQKFDVPLEQVTTPSLEALQAYSLGLKTMQSKGPQAAIPYFKRAIALDPSFASAYALLGFAYDDLGETGLEIDYKKQAFAQRERASEREKFFIEATYHRGVTGDLGKEAEILELWRQAYPRDPGPWGRLASLDGLLGRFEKSAAETRESMRLSGQTAALTGGLAAAYGNLSESYLFLDRWEEAKTAADAASAENADEMDMHQVRYALALLHGDANAMREQLAWSADKPEFEDPMLFIESETEAAAGHLTKSRDLSLRAAGLAERFDLKEQAADWRAMAALREAFFGNAALALQDAQAALQISSARNPQAIAALAFAVAGDPSRAQTLADALNKEYASNTILNSYWLPAIRAQIAMDHNKPADALGLLEAAEPIELSPVVITVDYACLYPTYVRGQAYLSEHQSAGAAAEFQEYIDHRGLAWNCPLSSLAHLGLARAYALQGDTAKARAAYNDFLTLWKDADADIPILIAAKSEYAKLR
jgi:predicted Zn-dependent protease